MRRETDTPLLRENCVGFEGAGWLKGFYCDRYYNELCRAGLALVHTVERENGSFLKHDDFHVDHFAAEQDRPGKVRTFVRTCLEICASLSQVLPSSTLQYY